MKLIPNSDGQPWVPLLAEAKKKAKKGDELSQAPLGSGGRFAALRAKIAARGNVDDPDAVAAWIGRKKYGAGAMAKMAAAGRRRSQSK